MPGEKTQAVWDYSEHATITQGQLLEKSSKNAIFLKVMWKTPLFKRLSRPARARESGIVLFCAGRATPGEICRAGPMVSGTDWRMLQQRISRAAGLAQRGVGVAFLDAPPPDLEKFEGTAPSGCSFWRLAAAGRSFYTVPHDHFNCAVGAHTHNIPLSCGREKETGQTLQMLFDLGYVKPEEVERIPRWPKTPAAVAYAPLGSLRFEPDVVLFACKPSSAMLLNEAAARTGIQSGARSLAALRAWRCRQASKPARY
jgi:uncharacterized protein (DUF169 family)